MHSVVCNTRNDFWTCGNDKIIRKYWIDSTFTPNIDRTIASELYDIAVTERDEIVYTVKSKKIIHIAKSGYSRCTQELIKLKDFEPRSLYYLVW